MLNPLCDECLFSSFWRKALEHISILYKIELDLLYRVCAIYLYTYGLRAATICDNYVFYEAICYRRAKTVGL